MPPRHLFLCARIPTYEALEYRRLAAIHSSPTIAEKASWRANMNKLLCVKLTDDIQDGSVTINQSADLSDIPFRVDYTRG